MQILRIMCASQHKCMPSILILTSQAAAQHHITLPLGSLGQHALQPRHTISTFIVLLSRCK